MIKINLLKQESGDLEKSTTDNIEKVFSVNLKEGLAAHTGEIEKYEKKGYGARVKSCKSVKDDDEIVVGYDMTINFYK